MYARAISSPAAPSEPGTTHVLRLAGLHCAACAQTIAAALRALPGVASVQANAAARCATVRADAAVAPQTLIQAVHRAGYDAALDTPADARALRRRESRRMLWRLFVAVFCAMQVMMLAAPSYIATPGELPLDQKRLLDWGGWLLTLPVLLFSAGSFFAGAWASARQRRINADWPIALSIAVTFVASTGAAFDPAGLFGSTVYFDSLTMFVAIVLSARWLEMTLRHRAEAALDADMAMVPQHADRVHADGRVETVPTADLQRGDVVRIAVGAAFPVDGRLRSGETLVDEALLTGESTPQRRRSGQAVCAGSVNLRAPVEVEVERVGGETRFGCIAALARHTRTARPNVGAAAERWTAPFVAGVLMLAALTALVWWWIDPSRALPAAVAVLVVTCPCALAIAAPAALLTAASTMGRRGVTLTRLDAIDTLAHVDVLCIDKTGTLTESSPRCIAHWVATTNPPAEGIAASLAAHSQHPLSRALRDTFDAAPTRWARVEERAGCGLEGIDADGISWRLGHTEWALAKNDAGRLGASSADLVLTRERRLVAQFSIGEQTRTGALAALNALTSNGVAVHLLSGDDPTRVQRAAAGLPLVEARGALTPQDKQAALAQLQAQGHVVAMLGDGINDAPVLAQANVSIAMGDGSAMAKTHADAVLVSARLADLAAARRLAQRTLRIVKENFAWAALYNAIAIPLAATGVLSAFAAGVGMACSSLVVVLNAARLSRSSTE